MAKQSLAFSLLCMAVIIISSAQMMPPELTRRSCTLTCPDNQSLDQDACVCVDLDVGSLTTECQVVQCFSRGFIPCLRYKTDERGCQTCECVCSAWSLRCPYDCEYGTEYITTSEGCEACQCASSPTVQLP